MTAAKWKNLLSNIPGGNAQNIQKLVRQSNVNRALYIATGSVAVNIFFLLHFYFNVNAGTPVETKWRSSIITLHLVFICINLLLLAIVIYIKKTRQYAGNLALFAVTSFFITLPLWGAAASILDQWVNASVISFFLTCAVCAMALMMRPAFALLYYAGTYIVFYAGLALTQANADLLLTDRVNGFAGVAICCGVSVLLWRTNIIRYVQGNLIQQHKKDMQDNYEKLLESSDELTKANAAKDKFFSIIAHDLRGPVSSILGLIEFINSDAFEETPERQHEMLQLLHKSIGNTAKLLENLLVWSRSQTNRIHYNPVFLNLQQLVETNIQLLNIMASEKNIVIDIDISPGMEVYADVEMINTVLRNLLSNALKFTNNAGKVVITGNLVKNNPGSQPGSVQVIIEDNGVGMRPAVLEGIFRIDTKVLQEGTRKETGTGLGLILCKEFIEKHNGSIWATSKPGAGSRFTFQLPVVDKNA